MPVIRSIVLPFLLVLLGVTGLAMAAENPSQPGKIAFLTNLSNKQANSFNMKNGKSRYTKPGFYGKSYPQLSYKGIILIGNEPGAQGIPSNDTFFVKIRQAIDMIAKKSPAIFRLMQNVNPGGRRIISYTGKIGPASFAVWNGDFVVNISVTSIDDDPVFENTPYSLAASLVHELVGHGRQEMDSRLWAMYDWCGKDSADVEGVLWQANHTGASSGLVEYEANLFARWFLETVRGTYPNLVEPAVRRYVKTVRIMKKRFPGWYDERKDAVALLNEFGSHFANVCPEIKFTPHPIN